MLAALHHLGGSLRFFGAAFHETVPTQHVGRRVEEHAFSGQAVTAGAARLLLIMLDRFRKRRVDHTSDVATVDSHAEGDRRHNHVDLLRGEAILRAPALLRLHPGVIVGGPDGVRLQIGRHLLGLFATDAVYNRSLARVPAQHAGHLRIDVQLRDHPVKQIRPIERAD